MQCLNTAAFKVAPPAVPPGPPGSSIAGFPQLQPTGSPAELAYFSLLCLLCLLSLLSLLSLRILLRLLSFLGLLSLQGSLIQLSLSSSIFKVVGLLDTLALSAARYSKFSGCWVFLCFMLLDIESVRAALDLQSFRAASYSKLMVSSII